MIFPSVIEQLSINAQRRPDAPAYIDDQQSLTWRETENCAQAVAQRLRDLNVGAGTSVAILLRNSAESAVMLHAVWRIGATGVLVNPGIEMPAVLRQLKISRATVVLHDTAHAELADRLHDETGLPTLSGRFDVNSASDTGDAALPGTTDHAIISFTSGTTGVPKGTVCTFASLAERGGAYAVAGALCHKDRGLVTTPMCMAGSLNLAVLPYLYSGAACILTQHTKGASVASLIESQRVTTMFTVPLISRRITEAATPKQLASLRFILSSGAALPSEVLNDLVRLGVDVHEVAGTSESAGGTYITQTQRALKPKSIGVAMFGCSVTIRDPSTDEVLPDGVDGEIVIAGPMVGNGYLREEGYEPFPESGTRSGDLGRRDEDGFLYVTGRLKDTIVTGGQNVYPLDVEDAIRRVPGIDEVVVFGIPDPQWGEAVSAVVVLSDPDLDATRVHESVRTFLAPYQVPKYVATLDSIPYTSMGKIDRQLLRSIHKTLPGTSRATGVKPSDAPSTANYDAEDEPHRD